MYAPMKRIAAVFTLSLIACAERPPAKAPSQDQPKTERQRVASTGYFDVATLSNVPPAIPARVNKEVLTGVEVAARAHVLECLVDPKSRGPEKNTSVVVDASLGDAGVVHEVSGQNLTPAGVACVEGVLSRWTSAVPGLDAKAASGPVQSHVEFQHVEGTSPAVKLGVSEASDVAAAVRLALPSWGECFTDWKTTPPRPLKASIEVRRPAGTPPAQVAPSEVAFASTSDPTADKVAACLKGKILALQVKTPTAESLALPYAFHFVHSGIRELLPGAAPEVQFVELDLQRGRSSAEAAIAVGERAEAVKTYDAAVAAYKANAKPAVTVKELKDKCAALLAADDKVIEALKKQKAVEDTTHRFAAEQKANDPSWAEAERAAGQNAAQAAKDLESFVGFRKQDEAACPKVR